MWLPFLILLRDATSVHLSRQAAALLQLLRMPAGDEATALRRAIKRSSLKVHLVALPTCDRRCTGNCRVYQACSKQMDRDQGLNAG